jgi:hypothetical protein
MKRLQGADINSADELTGNCVYNHKEGVPVYEYERTMVVCDSALETGKARLSGRMFVALSLFVWGRF